MQAQSAQPVRTFTIGFREDGFDEAAHAKAVASHLGTDHTELYLGAKEALDVIPRLPELYDEPFADSSQIPTFLVSQLARRHVTVSLSGDGGDELLCGYTRYRKAATIWRKIGWLPSPLRTLMSRSMHAVPSAIWRSTLGPDWADRVDARSELLRHRTPMALYRGLLSQWQQPTQLVLGAREPSTPFTDPGAIPHLSSFTDEMMFLDAISYLPDDILVKVDRASMGVSLEARVPLLDHRLVELAWRMPLSLKARAGDTKWILRQILHRHVPRELVDRPKKGFSVPIEAWLRGPLRPWAEDLLAPDRLRREGFLDPAPVQAALRAHLSGERHRPYHLWNVLMFQAWLAKQRG
jgi:asparagine synthase (glutamine-hydrolysing)